MVKQKVKASGLGRSLIRDRMQKGARPDGYLHTTDLNDGQDWSTNMQSITEQNNLDEFLATAELAGLDFTAEKLNIKVVSTTRTNGLLSQDELRAQKELYLKHSDSIRVPRRPDWDARTTAEQLDLLERESFLAWRRSLAELQENEGITMTPYEKNLEFWRQLWRVCERSDIIVQILDSRNPLLFYCEDLFKYVKEISPHKKCMVLLNKSDFLTEDQRKQWAEYFKTKENVMVVFFSALNEAEKTEEEEDEEAEIANELEDMSISGKSIDLWSKEQLVHFFRTWHTDKKYKEGTTTVGLVGYPNVGKSSTINAIVQSKKVSVSSTPGKTKHFQTIHLCEDLILCDCPGLVFPNFVSCKAEMVINGILPIDQLRDHVPSVNLVLSLIPRHIFEELYGICIPAPPEGDDPNRPPTSHELLNAYSYMRGYMTSSGQPDNPRGARYVLKDFVNGKLCYCIAPPGVAQEQFHTFRAPTRESSKELPIHVRMTRERGMGTEDLDKNFFDEKITGHGYKGTAQVKTGLSTKQATAVGAKRHGNRGKREKLRRLHGHLDA